MVLAEAHNCVYDAEEAIPILTLLEILPEYLAIDGGAKVSVVRHDLVVCEALF